MQHKENGIDELGIVLEDVSVDEFILLGLNYHLFIVWDIEPALNPNKIVDIKYVTRDDSKELLRKVDAEKVESENLLCKAFSLFLFNSKYELLLQQQSATNRLYFSFLYKLLFKGVRNVTQRKLHDELYIVPEDVPIDEFIPLGVGYLLFVIRDIKPNLNPDEVADIKYVTRDYLKELLRKANAGEEGLKLSPWFRLVVDNFLFNWEDHVEKGTLQEATDMKTIHKLS
ncbi:hypothetical protein M9H77_27499 [Catharanthus roseus]|uniref:Uncharacterized protein n=1 Tax=Catharanthus roseus TaxID=4058 RepID=A0ACC0AD86_CATRO|nr:hypothetical protein M9H77_27499 [Catharanthus roseus]